MDSTQSHPLRKFRRGTKRQVQRTPKLLASCIECRQRKVRCLWQSDDAQSCRHCSERQRTCVLQHVAARNPESLRLSSRDRISRLEGNLASLWRYVKAQQHDARPDTTEPVVGEVTDDDHGGRSEVESEAEMSDPSPANPPTHIRSLFNHSLLDIQEQAPRFPRHQRPSESRLSRARGVLQSLMVSREAAHALASQAAEWVTWANSIAPLVFIARTKDELLLDWDRARGPDAQPTAIAAVLLITAQTIQLRPQDSVHCQLTDVPAYSKTVSDTIESDIVNDDFFAGTLEGIEICLLFQRLHFAHARFHKVWLSLRRTIALAEILGLPHASINPSTNRSAESGWTRNGQTREQAGASLWESACTMERLAGCMFGFSITARMEPLPADRPVFVGTHLVPQAYFCRLADIAGKIPAIDDLSAKGQPPRQVCDTVLNIDQEFRELASLAPMSWWDVHPDQGKLTLDLVLQYFHQYFLARAHLQLALNNDRSDIYAYSHIVCTEACREVAVRYAILRPLVLGGFFPVRLFDLQALTAAIFLVHTCYCPGSLQGVEPARTPSSRVLIQRLVDSMDLASGGEAGQFAQEAARTIRSLCALLSNQYATDSRYIGLTVPLLGRIHVRRQDATPRSTEPSAGSSTLPHQTYGTRTADPPLVLQGGETANAIPMSAVANDPNGWSMEISGALPFLTDDAFVPDQWLMLGDFNTDGLSFEQM